MTVFEELKQGLNEAIAHEKGTRRGREVTLSIRPVSTFTPQEIKAIRNSTGLTQVLFAGFLGVSVKTVEAWEAGRNHPEGAACRLLFLTQMDSAFPEKSGIVVR